MVGQRSKGEALGYCGTSGRHPEHLPVDENTGSKLNAILNYCLQELRRDLELLAAGIIYRYPLR